MTIKYTIQAATTGAVERLEIGKHTFVRDHKCQEFGLISGDDDFSEQAADAGFPCDIADEIFDALDTLSEDLEDD